ncbi:ribosome hibernation-promoting factor, HPF/YfiA family [Oceanirhabdus sp. W0125-5]|uniref:ribosome hibernation-promoting factor, HPF/YfiA family n=1 Tax=Oceanirhabdus sp. W0125-5 TaxID=2999116 RepID=UPI0022F30D67|nr:ribosome-associated translation inhibitor RaiA [Oceanirhabdus sp. W0125-5]WBW98508.1 ribosome-associated translation inhibitor RaiA [Oceanirhabdus sp. W0125-5]
MKVKIIGKDIKVTKALNEVIEKKLMKLDKYFKPEVEAHVTLSVVKSTHSIEIMIPFNGVYLRAEEKNEDMYTALDLILDKLERQIRKQKTRMERKLHGSSLIYEKIPNEVNYDEARIVKTKRFAIKPMDPEEAILQMDLIGHNFFVFLNAETEEVSVVYKRKDGNYGLIEPEF